MCRVPRGMQDNNFGFFCSDDVIATCAHYFITSYEVMYYDALQISYTSKTDEGIGNNIFIENIFEGVTYLNNLLIYSGLAMEYYPDNELEMITEIKSTLSKNIPVILAIDAYYYPWDWRYHEIKGGRHSLIIKSYHEEDKCFICMDPYYQKDNLELPLYELIQGKIKVTSLSPIMMVKEYNDVTELLKRVNKSVRKSIHNVYKELSEDIKYKFNIKKEIINYTNNERLSLDELQKRMPINEAFQKISNNRQRYSILLRYIGNNNKLLRESLYDLADKYLYLAEKWDMLRLMFIKQMALKQIENIANYISTKIMLLAEEEDQVMIQTEAVLLGKHNYTKENNDYVVQMQIKNYVNVKLDKYCNNIGIGSKVSKSANLNGAGNYFMADDILKSGCLPWDNFEFNIVSIGEDKFDNVYCNGQHIIVPERNYTFIYLLGCSEWGNYGDEIVLSFQDGSYVKKRVYFLDWTPDMNKGKPTDIIYSGKAIMRYKETYYVNENLHYLYVVKIPLPFMKKLNEIILPHMINIHIFSIMLGEV